jgi:hypothetical protein
MHPQVRQHLGIAIGMQSVIRAGRVAGLTQDSQGDMVTLPSDVAAGCGGIGKRLAARPAIEQTIKTATEIAPANGGGGADADGGSGKANDGDQTKFMHHDDSP